MNYRCPANYNPADFYIKTLAIEPNNREICKQNVKVSLYFNGKYLSRFNLVTKKIGEKKDAKNKLKSLTN